MQANKIRISSKAAAVITAGAMSLSHIVPSYSALEREVAPSEVVTEVTELAFLIRPEKNFVEPMVSIEKVFSNPATAQITRVLNSAAGECRSVGAEYEASCAAQAYKKAARAANRPDYVGARRILNKASRDLSRLVSQNADKTARKKKGRSGTYRAVKKAVVKKVARQALKIITETQTKLLRSSGSAQRKTHYKRIAKAVGSTKVIFRS